MVTATTIPLLALILFLWYKTKASTLSMVLFTSVFEAASAFNVGSLGVSPALFTLAICLGIKMLKGHHPLRFVSSVNRLSLKLFMIFVIYAIYSGFVYPFVFEGVFIMRGSTSTSLAWSQSNFAQICYLIASSVLYFTTITSSSEELQNAIDWYIYGCIISSIISVYQMVNAVFHIPYPESILYSNPSHVIYRAYMINGMWRLNSTFPEAAEFSTYITVAIGLLVWRMITRTISIWYSLWLILMIIMLLMTESSLGYICFLFTALSGSFIYIRRSLTLEGLVAKKLTLIIVSTMILAITMVSSSKVRQGINKTLFATLVDKKNSDSYRDRTNTHASAINVLHDTYYLGAGWGSIRASGLAFVLLGNVGLIGLCLFMSFCISLALPLFRRRQAIFRSSYDLYEQCLFALAIMLIGLAVAGAEPVQPILWVMFGVATVGRIPQQYLTCPVVSSKTALSCGV